MRRRPLVALGACGLVGGLLGLAPLARAADEPVVVGTPDTTVGPLISGTASYVDGTYAWTDYAYDDRGASSAGSPGNAADLIQLQVSLVDGGLRLRAVLETLVDPGVPVVRVGVDGDVVTLGDADVLTNSVEAMVPEPVGDVVHLTASVGVAGSDAVYDLAFVHAEDVCTMPAPGPTACVPNSDNQPGQHLRQADVIAGRLPATEAVGTVDLAILRSGATDLARVDRRGFHTLLYHSDLALGEGLRQSGSNVRSTALPHTIFAGSYQPYVVRLPVDGGGPLPTVVYLHGRSGNHLQAFVNNFREFDVGAMVVGVLGRGYDVGYGGIDWSGFVEPEGAYGERDVLDVLGDLRARGLVDPERVVIGGISMGGVGAFHVAEHHPDLFTGVLPIVGGDAGILPANWTPGLIENLSNMPMRMANGAIDPLAHLGSQLTPAMLHGIRTVDFRAWEAVRRHHEWQEGLVDCVWTELLSNARVVDPARVIYGVNPAFEVQVPETGLDMTHDGAYWVSGLAPRPDAAPANRSITSVATSRIDVRSLARPVRTVVGTDVADASENFSAGADYCGASTHQSQDAWEMHGLVLAPGAPEPTSNGMTVALVGLTEATLDLPRMGVTVDAPVHLAVTGDGTGAITLTGPWPDGASVSITRDGEPLATVAVAGGSVTVTDDFLGTHDYEVAAAA